jgi:predicted metal-dependent phosphoesterase TrpH
MRKLEDALVEINHLITLVSKDELDKESVAFAIAKDAVEFESEKILDSVPKEYASLVKNMVSTYKKNGEYKVYSGIGCADHTEMVASLARIIKGQ